MSEKKDRPGDRHNCNTRYGSDYVLPTHMIVYEHKQGYLGKKLLKLLTKGLKRSQEKNWFKIRMET